MSSVDDRIVKMQFDNAQFKKGAAETKQSLTAIDSAINTAGKGKGLLNLSRAMETVGVTASKMAIVTTTAIATITNKVVNSGIQMVKGLTLDPLKQGFSEYESLLTKQNVIQNATGKSAKVVKGALNELNEYSDKTIYSFGNMTDAVQKFVNAGVDLDTSVVTIKGIANAAAFAGASSEEANRAMYAFAQSMSLGFIQLQDWNQIENANLGTIKFKNELLNAGVAAGTLTKRGKEFITQSGKSISATKGWRDGLQEQWATTEVLNKALGKYADTSTTLGKKAFKSAQEVRTFSAFMDTLKESLGSGWSQIFTALIGGLDEATKMWTGLSNSIGKTANDFFNFATTAIITWKALGGGAKVMQGLRNIASPFVALFTAIGDAWQAAFPTTGKGAGGVLYQLSSGFEALTRPLTVVAGWITNLTPILTILFKTVKMGADGISVVAKALGDLITMASATVSSDGFVSFFDSILNATQNAVSAGLDFAGDLVQGIIQGFQDGGLDTAVNVFSAGLLGGIFLAIRKVIKSGISVDLGNGLLEGITDGFGALTGSLTAMQNSLQAKTLMSIAIAIGVMTASMVALSMIPGEKLAKSLTAISLGMGQLLIGMAIISKVGGFTAFVTLPVIAAGLVLLATSLLILTAAIAAMSALSWESMAKGLTGIGGALVVIAAGMKLMPKSLPITAAGLVLVSIALNAIATAMILMGTLSWDEIGRGLTVTAGSLLVIGAAMKLMPKTLPITAAGLVLVGIALNAIAASLKVMATMSWKEIGRGLATLGGSMAILAVGLNLMRGTLMGSAAMMVAAIAIGILTPSLLLMSKLSWKSLSVGLIALAGGLLIIAGALYLMTGAIPGALALLIVAPALLALATALTALGALSWESLAIALIALAASLTIIGIAGLLIAPVVIPLMGLGVALLLLGAGLALAGIGVVTFATGLGILVGLGAAAIVVMSKAITAFIDLLPELGEGFGKFIVEFSKAIAANAPVLVKAFIDMLSELIAGATKLLPKLGTLFSKILTTLVKIIRDNVPKIVSAGVSLILDLIDGMTANVPKVAEAVTALIIAFIGALALQSITLITAGVKTIIAFNLALAAAIKANAGPLVDSMIEVGKAMAQGMAIGLAKMATAPWTAAFNMGKGAVKAAAKAVASKSPSRKFIEIGKFMAQGLAIGIQNHAALAITATANMMKGQIAMANEYVDRLIQKLDQKAIAARGRADGLARAADRAERAANKTKSKKDDKAAGRLSNTADKAGRKADKAESVAQSKKDQQDRQAEFKRADSLGKAQMRSEDAQNQLDAAKAAESRAVRARTQADALDREARNKNYSAKERKRMKKEADDLRKQAAADAAAANRNVVSAKKSAADALRYQKIAGAEAAAAFQKAYLAEAKSDADDKAFEKLTDSEKAVKRKEQAAALQKQADADLAAAKKLAYTDLEGANDLASKALDEAERARQYLDEANALAASAAQGTSGSVGNGSVVNLDPTDAAAIAMNDYSDLYDNAVAAAAATKSVEFNQYNTSPEALNPIEIYRQSNNLFNYAVDKIDEAA